MGWGRNEMWVLALGPGQDNAILESTGVGHRIMITTTMQCISQLDCPQKVKEDKDPQSQKPWQRPGTVPSWAAASKLLHLPDPQPPHLTGAGSRPISQICHKD